MDYASHRMPASLGRALLSSDVDNTTCSAYGWCCDFSNDTLQVGSYEVYIVPVCISVLLLLMMLFLVVNVAINYLQSQKATAAPRLKTPSSIPVRDYSTFVTPPSIPAREEHSFEYSDLSRSGSRSNSFAINLSSNPLTDPNTMQAQIGFTQYERMVEEQEKVKAQRQQKVKSLLRPIYFLYVLLACLWMLAEALVILTPSSGNPVLKVLEIALFELHILLDNFIIFLSFFRRDGTRSIIFSLVACLIWMAIISSISISFEFTQDCSTCQLFYPAPQAFYVYLAIFLLYLLCIILTYSRFRFKPRPTVKYWLWFLLSVFSFALLGSGLVLFADSDSGFCMMNLTALWYTLAYAPLLYYTVRRDSTHLHKVADVRVRESNDININPAVVRALELVKRHSVGWIPFEHLIIGPRLGVGAAGEVHKALYLQTPVAVKRLFDKKSQTLEDFFREVTVMSKLTHPNIVLFMGVCVKDNGERYIITEMMNKGSVFDLIHPNLSFSALRDPEADNQLTGERIKWILIQCARGMAYLHSFKPAMLHRDLKSHNLLVDDNWNVKVADFGLSRPQSLNTMTAAGTPQWSAPEVIRQDRYTEKADVYSFGIIIFEMLTGEIPYMNMAPLSAAHRVAYEGLRPMFSPGCDRLWADFACECWAEDPDERPTFEEVVRRLEQMPEPVNTPDGKR